MASSELERWRATAAQGGGADRIEPARQRQADRSGAPGRVPRPRTFTKPTHSSRIAVAILGWMKTGTRG